MEGIDYLPLSLPAAAMSLSPGDRLGSYRVTALIGMGGMGEVYRAHDETLGRDVALKILTSAFANDPERLARFEREARLLAALNHPHIAAIYGIAQADGVRALVLELVEGPTLVDRVRVGALPVQEAISIRSASLTGVGLRSRAPVRYSSLDRWPQPGCDLVCAGRPGHLQFQR
jgi:serine/threonine protein kinase